MRLHLTPTSPYARKVHVALIEKGVPFELVHVTLPAPGLVALNPLAKVPTLELDDGRGLYDSPVILQWLERFDPKLYPADLDARVEVMRWEALCDGLCDAVVATVLEKRRAQPDAGVLANHEGKARRALERMNADVGQLLGFTAADVAIAAALGYVDLRAPQLRAGLAGLDRHFDALKQRPSVQRTAPPT
jgi:glutathione S-transferase